MNVVTYVNYVHYVNYVRDMNYMPYGNISVDEYMVIHSNCCCLCI